jgi:hypothetical protein
LQYVHARESVDEEAALWRRYVADSLFNTAHNQHFRLSYSELLTQMHAQNNDSAKGKSADDIAADIIKRHGIKFERKENCET